MSYEWIRRRKRYLSFRYLFPEMVAPWIQLKRAALRVVWFFTHPMDEFIEDVGELIAWPFVTLAKMFAWMLEGIREFFVDLFAGIEAFFRYLGGLPVWTGSAIAGALGIIMTILLFFLQVASFEPVPLSAGAAVQTEPAGPVVVVPAEDEPAWRPQPVVETNFDVFAGAPAVQPEPEQWRPTPPPTEAGIEVELTRLAMPFAARERIDVVSMPPQADLNGAWNHFERMTAATGWSPTRGGVSRSTPQFTPYVLRQPLRNVPLSAGSVRAGNSVSPFAQVQNSRQPAVSIARTAPSSSSVGGALTYELLVRNQGLEPLDSVLVHETVSAIERVMNVEPPAHVVDDALVWRVHDLQPREQRRLTIEMRPDELVPVAGGSIVQVKTAVAALSRVSEPLPQAPPITETPGDQLNVFLPEPEPEPQLTRPEPQPETEPEPQIGLILPTFHDEPEPEAEPQPEPEPELQFEPPAQFEPLLPEPVAQEPAPAEPMLPLERPRRETPAPATQWRERVQTARSQEGVPIFFEMRTPRNVAVDRSVATVFEIRNPGSVPLTDLVILVEVTDELDHKKGRILEHRIQRLAPGGVYFTRLTTTAVRDGKARVRSTLTSAEELQSTLEAEIEISRPKQKPSTQLSKADLPPEGHGRPTSTQ